MKWIKVLEPAELKSENFMTRAVRKGKWFCIMKYNEKYYVTQLSCPHAGADLSAGWCKDGKLICPHHRYSYCLETGRGAPGQGDYINTFPVDLRLDGLYVGVTERWQVFKKLFRL